jgi:hypothetical protein
MKYTPAKATTTNARLQARTLRTLGPSSAPLASIAVSTICSFSCSAISILPVLRCPGIEPKLPVWGRRVIGVVCGPRPVGAGGHGSGSDTALGEAIAPARRTSAAAESIRSLKDKLRPSAPIAQIPALQGGLNCSDSAGRLPKTLATRAGIDTHHDAGAVCPPTSAGSADELDHAVGPVHRIRLDRAVRLCMA